MSRVFPNVKNFMACPEFPMGSKLHFSQFVDKFSHNNVKFEMWSVLCKLPILFSIVKLKLGHNFNQFTNRFKIGPL